MKEYRGTLTEPGKEDPAAGRSIEENLQLFEDMRAGKFADGERYSAPVSIWLLPT